VRSIGSLEIKGDTPTHGGHVRVVFREFSWTTLLAMERSLDVERLLRDNRIGRRIMMFLGGAGVSPLLQLNRTIRRVLTHRSDTWLGLVGSDFFTPAEWAIIRRRRQLHRARDDGFGNLRPANRGLRHEIDRRTQLRKHEAHAEAIAVVVPREASEEDSDAESEDSLGLEGAELREVDPGDPPEAAPAEGEEEAMEDDRNVLIPTGLAASRLPRQSTWTWAMHEEGLYSRTLQADLAFRKPFITRWLGNASAHTRDLLMARNERLVSELFEGKGHSSTANYELYRAYAESATRVIKTPRAASKRIDSMNASLGCRRCGFRLCSQCSVLWSTLAVGGTHAALWGYACVFWDWTCLQDAFDSELGKYGLTAIPLQQAVSNVSIVLPRAENRTYLELINASSTGCGVSYDELDLDTVSLLDQPGSFHLELLRIAFHGLGWLFLLLLVLRFVDPMDTRYPEATLCTTCVCPWRLGVSQAARFSSWSPLLCFRPRRSSAQNDILWSFVGFVSAVSLVSVWSVGYVDEQGTTLASSVPLIAGLLCLFGAAALVRLRYAGWRESFACGCRFCIGAGPLGHHKSQPRTVIERFHLSAFTVGVAFCGYVLLGLGIVQAYYWGNTWLGIPPAPGSLTVTHQRSLPMPLISVTWLPFLFGAWLTTFTVMFILEQERCCFLRIEREVIDGVGEGIVVVLFTSLGLMLFLTLLHVREAQGGVGWLPVGAIPLATEAFVTLFGYALAAILTEGTMEERFAWMPTLFVLPSIPDHPSGSSFRGALTAAVAARAYLWLQRRRMIARVR
jgi:hypothetical protein